MNSEAKQNQETEGKASVSGRAAVLRIQAVNKRRHGALVLAELDCELLGLIRLRGCWLVETKRGRTVWSPQVAMPAAGDGVTIEPGLRSELKAAALAAYASLTSAIDSEAQQGRGGVKS